MANVGVDGSFSPNVAYTMTELAQKLGVSEKWIKTNLIDTGECAFKRRGNTYLFLGEWIINWCMADHEMPTAARLATEQSRKSSATP